MADNAAMPAFVRGVNTTQERPGVSLWLYAAGLVVTLVGVCTVGYAFGDPSFTVLTVGLSVIGYLFSITTRKLNLRVQAVQAPAFILLALAVIALSSSGTMTSLIIPDAASKDKLLTLQAIILWVAVLQSYTLTSDSSVLFACVPCMTSLSLMSVRDTDPVVQEAFLLFISAATFLMVHDNYLQTLRSRRLCRVSSSRNFFLGQATLAAACLCGSLALASVVKVPLQALGTTLFGNVAAPDANKPGLLSALMPGVQVTEHHHVTLAAGPTANSDVSVMEVKTKYLGSLYWQGATFTVFTGRSFVNPDTNTYPLRQTSDTSQMVDPGQMPISKFAMVQQILEPPDDQMRHSTLVRQHIIVTGGNFSVLYGADKIESIRGAFSALMGDSGGTVLPGGNLTKGIEYTVMSRIPCQDPARLRHASTNPADIPKPVRDLCLQTQVNDTNDVRLQDLAAKITKGLTNEYDRAEAIRQYIASHCDYNLNAPAAPPGVNVVDYFLFKSHQGYCDLFGASMVMLCRYAGIPARLASGFLEGDPGSNGTWIVRSSQKHLWAQVFFPGYGWINFDATGGSKDITKHAAGTPTGTGFLKWVQSNGPIPLAAIAVVCVILGYVLKVELFDKIGFNRSNLHSGKKGATSQVYSAYFSVITALERHGIKRPPSMTATEFANQLAHKVTWTDETCVTALYALTDIFERAVYGANEAGDQEIAAAQASAATLLRALNAQNSQHALNTRIFAWS